MIAILAIIGSLIGSIFGKALIGAAVGALIPVAWVIIVVCFFAAAGFSVVKFFKDLH